MIAWLLAGVALASPVEGRVRQKGDDAPVEDLTVTVDGQPVAVEPDGRFTLELPDGAAATLTVRSPAHLPVEITVTPPVETPVRVWLTRRPGPAEIVVEAFRPTAELSREKVDAEMAYETPGTYDDAVRLIAALPGVAVQRDLAPSAGDISVRGALPTSNRSYLDGIEVPYLYHFNQYASVFPATQLSSLELYSTGYGARFGDSVGAIVEAETTTTRPDDVVGHASLNLVTVGGDVKVPLKGRWWIGVSGRRSFQDLISRGSAQYPRWPVFYDGSIRAELDHGERGFGVFATVAGDRYERVTGELDVQDPLEATTTPTLDYGRNWQMLGFRARWKGGRAVGGFVSDVLRAQVSVGGLLDQKTFAFPVRVDAHGQLTEHFSWEAGGELRSEIVVADVVGAGAQGALVGAEAPPLAWGVTAGRTIPRTRVAAYAGVHGRFGPARIMPSLRVGFDSASLEPTIEPRLATRFRVAEQTELRLGGGLYRERPDTSLLLVDPELPTTSAWVVTGGLEQTIAGRVEIVAEGWGRFLKDVIWQPIAGAPAVADRGVSYGGELTLKYRLRETFYLWAWFSYGRSFLRSDDARFPSRADQPLAGGVVASYNPIRALDLAARWRIGSGMPYTSIDDSAYDGTHDTWQPRYGAPNGARMPLYQKIDLRVGYTFAFPRWSLAVNADVWIVPGKAAALYPTYSYDYRTAAYVMGPHVLPLIGVRASF